jgi:thioredoxin reductase (NADPH)
MFDYDVIIIGAGPAGLTAGLYLSRANYRTLILEKENFGGPMKNIDWLENYPGFAEGVSGPHLASEMVKQATKYGVQLKQAEVTGIDCFSSSRLVNCADGTGYTCAVVVVAAGARRKKLNVPNEEALQGKGVFNCALCDGSKFKNRVVAVCGGGDSGLTEALYLTKLTSKVILVEGMPQLTASAILQRRASEAPNLEIRCGLKIEAIVGDSCVTGIEYRNSQTGERGTLNVDGVLVYIGLEPNTDFLQDVVPLDDQGRITVNQRMETETPYVFAAGDIRSGSPGQIIAAAGDGAMAAIVAQELMQKLAQK